MNLNLNIELERRLLNWAYWVIAFANNEVGYPAKSTIADFGLTDSHIRKSKPPFSLNNLQADELNGWINIMGKFYPHYKTILGAYYLRKRGLRISDLATIFKISERRFKQQLHDARLWLSGRLSIES